MISTQKLPACHRYIKGEHSADTLYTLTKYTAPRHIAEITDKEFHALLCADGILSAEQPLPKKRSEATCFQIISEYKCGHICPLCSYSSRYKNALEAEESVLLVYALKNYQSFYFLKENGLKAEHFQSLFLLNDFPVGKTALTLPLCRLAYSYIDHTGNKTLNFKNLPAMIAAALDQNNPGKLLPQNVQRIKEYLERLQKQCPSVKKEKIKEILFCILHPRNKQETPDIQAHNSMEQNANASCKESCIDGFLGSLLPESDNNISSPLVPAAKKQMELHTDATSESISNNEKSTTELPVPKKGLFFPKTFSTQDAERTGYPFHAVGNNATDLRQLEVFLQFNPLVGIEIVTDAESSRQMLLLCASNQFFYVPDDNETILSLLRLYFSKSPIRRQICMEPYKLHYFLHLNDICSENVYSLRTAYKVLSEAKELHGVKTHSEMIKELTSKINSYEYSPYIFSMPHYVKMYEVLSAHPVLAQSAHTERFRIFSAIDMLLGISYRMKDVADTHLPLFELNDALEFQFHYGPDLKLKEGFRTAAFTFSHKIPVYPLVLNILYTIARKKLADIYGYRLLQFSQNSIVIAAPVQHYEQLCEIIVNLSTYLAEKDGLASLVIKED